MHLLLPNYVALAFHTDIILNPQTTLFKIHQSLADGFLLQIYLVLIFHTEVVLSSQRVSFQIHQSFPDGLFTAEIRVFSFAYKRHPKLPEGCDWNLPVTRRWNSCSKLLALALQTDVILSIQRSSFKIHQSFADDFSTAEILGFSLAYWRRPTLTEGFV